MDCLDLSSSAKEQDLDPFPKPQRKKKKNVPVRKRLKPQKRHKKPHIVKAATVGPQLKKLEAGEENPEDVATTTSNVTAESSAIFGGIDIDQDNVSCSMSIPDLSEDISMDISDGSSLLSPGCCSTSEVSSTCSTPCPTPQPPTPIPCSTPEPLEEPIWDDEALRPLLLDVRSKLLFMLPNSFVPIIDNGGIHVIMLGRRESKAVQRELFFDRTGAVRIEVHGKIYPAKLVVPSQGQKPLTPDNLAYFVDRILHIVSKVRVLEICAGMDKADYKEAWPVTSTGHAESDTFKECRYYETFRSNNCSMLVEVKSWRCKECTKQQPILRRKLQSMRSESPHPCTNNRFLNEKQKDEKIEDQHRTVRNMKKREDRLQSRIEELMKQESVKVEKDLSDDLIEILQSASLTPNQSKFLQQQVKTIGKKTRGIRWHPTIIRLALSIYLRSPSAYKTLQESGFVKLPTSRTLFDYSHASRIQTGVDHTVVESVVKRVAAENLKHDQYHVVMADEIHISKNIVVQKSTGEVVGFRDLDQIDDEIRTLDSFLDDPDKKMEEQLATKILSFMVKGCSSKVKDVVASYPVCSPTPKQMYCWTWDVIGALERSGVKVVAFICDGASSNRAFIKLHKPVKVLPSGVIFETVNKCAPERLIWFFSDVPHLLKTIRNAFFNSRLGKKGVRCLKKNGQPIVWDTIIRLYLSKKDKTLRKSYKLNQQNVFPDSYSKMKVAPAGQVLSHTVGMDIQSQGWPQTKETVDFILKTNDWFDLLNGAFTTQGIKKNNPKLNAYTMKDIEEFENSVDDNRFQQLLDYLEYHVNWAEEVKSRMNTSTMSLMSEMGVQPLEGEESFHALPEDEAIEENEPDVYSKKCLLPHQTLLGIEMSTRSFISAVTFLIKAGVPFVNARVFCQDPLEQNFGKQRMGGGGSNNPNAAQYYHKQRAIHTIGTLGSGKRMAGNSGEVLDEGPDDWDMPLPKRRKTSRNVCI